MMRFIIFLITAALFLPSVACGQTHKKPVPLPSTFDGRTPCKELADQLEEKTTAECIKMKWRLILYQDSPAANSGTFELMGSAYREDNSQKGMWLLVRGTNADPEAFVYQLNLQGKKPLYLQKADENVLYFLDCEKNLLVGNKDFSYGLNRVMIKNEAED